jgi:hypothetical protein
MAIREATRKAARECHIHEPEDLAGARAPSWVRALRPTWAVPFAGRTGSPAGAKVDGKPA